MPDSDSSSDGDYYGPSLPPHLAENSTAKVIGPSSFTGSLVPDSSTPVNPVASHPSLPSIGPTLPPGFKLPPTEDDEDDEADKDYNPESTKRTLSDDNQQQDSESDDDDVIGPLPPDHPLSIARAAAHDSLRKPAQEDKPKKKLQREEWMLIPPSNKPVTELGLGPRKFLARAPEKPVKDNGEPMDSDEELERETRAAMDQKIIDDYDEKMQTMIEKASKGKHKSESLLEQHQRELKKKSKLEAAEVKKRKPFDRDTDLAVGGLSREDSKKYVEKTKELAGRFSKGRQKFL